MLGYGNITPSLIVEFDTWQNGWDPAADHISIQKNGVADHTDAINTLAAPVSATSGATNWMSPAYSPDTGLFYVVAQEGCGINTKSSDTFRPGGFPFMATGYIESPEEPWQMHVRALEVATGKLVWDYPQIGSKRYGAGLLSTAGGLLFAGNDQGGFDALSAKTGKPLWHFNTGQPISASPIAYSFKGKDYVAIAAGSNVVAFGLYE